MPRVGLAAGLAVGLAVPLLGAPAAGAADGGGSGGGPASAADAAQVTLITGDRVVLDRRGGEVVGLMRAEGREDVPVQTRRVGGDTYVIPLDARPLIADGTLDGRLFNVSELSREPYDAAAELPLIVTYRGQARTARAELREAAEEGPHATLEAIDGEAFAVDAESAAGVWEAVTHARSGIESVALDGAVRPALAESVPQIGAPEAWQAGYDGEGVTIAVLDTGISTEHADLAGGKVVASRNFSDSPDAVDRDGHGTHVASIAAGTGAHSGGTYTGVAPGASLLNGKVLSDDGFGSESGIIEGMEWAVAQGADVVNMSLGSQSPAGEEIDPLEAAINALSAESDTLFVTAAGNLGPDERTVSSPGTADAALTVGAVDKQDGIADFSSAGPRQRDGAVKPDVTAPGVGIGAALAPGSAAAEYGEPVADGYVALDGTSMAAPHVAGAAALLAQRHPEWTGERLKAALTGSAETAEGVGAHRQGAGRVDVAAALTQTVVAEPVSLNFGTVPYPHDAAEPVVRELTYRNLGERDVTLDLAVTGTDPRGEPAPEGMFSLGADTLTVPAGGTATVQATADTGAGGGEVYGAYSMHVTATTGGDGAEGQTVRTAGLVTREQEMHHLTVAPTGRDGEAAADWFASVTDLATLESYEVYPGAGGAQGTAGRIRLPEGRYLVETTIYAGTEEETTGMDYLVQPNRNLTRDVTAAPAATRAREVAMTVADEQARQRDLTVTFELSGDETGVGSGWAGVSGLPDGFRTAQLGEPAGGWEMSGLAESIWLRNRGAARATEYHAVHTREGSFYTGLTDHTTLDEMARITTRLGASVPDARGALFTASSLSAGTSAPEVDLPRAVDVYVTPGRWDQSMIQVTPDEGDIVAYQETGFRRYEAGQSVRRTLNTGVFGPMLRGGDAGLFRTGNTLHGRLNTFADGGGHAGSSGYDSARTTLYRDGERYATADDLLDYSEFELPAGEADYRLVTTVGRGAPVASVSTRITVSLTFASGSVPEGETVELPASVVRFRPALALDSTGPAGEEVSVPVTVQGSAAGTTPTVRVSYDGGETWRKVAVRDGAVTVTNPAAGGTVSFRATAVDAEGNRTVQTIIDAYRTA